MSNTRIIPLDKYEFTLDTNGWSFHICLGNHAHGNYIAIPDWGVCAEAADWSDTFYNKENLSNCNNDTVCENAEIIAKAVKQYMDRRFNLCH